MKFTSFAAAALLLASGSALAFDPKSDSSKDDLSAVAGKGADLAAFKVPQAKPAAYFADSKPLIVPAATVTWEKSAPAAVGDPDLDLSETSIDDSVPAEPAVADPADTQPAVGGPLEEVAAADLTTRPASQNYPACQPGPGDDNCIQLYEPGVRTAVASWTAPTGGVAQSGEAMAATATTESLNAQSLAMASAQVEAIRADGTALASAGTGAPAMGGPYEPVADEALAMNGDGSVDEELGETEDLAAI